MNQFEREYYLELLEKLEDEFDPTFISFFEKDLSDPDNLVSQISFSEYPLVLCAFLETAKYAADEDFTPFSEVTPPTMEEVEEFFMEYNNKFPTFLNIFSSVSCNNCEYFWEGIQYSRFHIHNQRLIPLHYALTFSDQNGLFHGKGKIPVGIFGKINTRNIIRID